MRHSPTTVKANAPLVDQAQAQPQPAGALSRRKFMSYLTVGATSLAVQGCGGGGASAAPVTTSVSSGGTGTGTTPTPVWTTVPTLVFTQGVKSSISVAPYVSVAGGSVMAMTLNAVALPAGVVFNGTTMSFDYDGVGALVVSDGHILTAVG